MLILRLSRPTRLETAAVFEALFAEQLGAAFGFRQASSDAWWRDVLGPPGAAIGLDEAAARLGEALQGIDFFAPDYEASLLAPLFVALRNRARVPARLLLVAHSPAASVLEWALLGRLLAPGDLIVAPSRSAAELIAFLSPDSAPFVSVIPHPMAPLHGVPRVDAAPRVVSLGRIHPGKLLHRQIEALDLLRRKGRALPLLEIGGAAADAGGQVYLRSLTEKVGRLKLAERVRFVGAIRGREAKTAFLAGARALLNLSATIEESFGKAPVEALGLGIPVLGTRWDGLPETIGAGGVLVPVEATRPGVPADVTAEAVAAGLERVLDAPPSPAACRRQSERCAPALVVPRYRALLEQAAELRAGGAFPEPPAPTLPAAPAAGLLGKAAPLTTLTWSETFAYYREACEGARRAWEEIPPPGAPSEGQRLRALLLYGTRWPIERFLAGLPELPAAPGPDAGVRVAGADFVARMAAAALAPGVLSTRLACLTEVRAGGDLRELERGLARLESEEHASPGIDVLSAEAACLAGRFETAFERAQRHLDLHADHEITAYRLRQIARVARLGGFPGRALPLLAQWLERFPDAPDSGAAWLDRCANATEAGGAQAEAAFALERARALLGDLPALDKLGARLAARTAAGELGATAAH